MGVRTRAQLAWRTGQALINNISSTAIAIPTTQIAAVRWCWEGRRGRLTGHSHFGENSPKAIFKPHFATIPRAAVQVDITVKGVRI